MTVEYITQKPNYIHPDKPSDIRKFGRPDTSAQIDFDPTRVDRIFKQKSMQKRILNTKGRPGQRSKIP